MANNSTPSFLEKVKSFFKALSKQQLIAIIAAVVAVAILIPVIIFVPKGNNTPEETTPATTTPAETTPEVTTPEVTTPDNTPDNTPVAKNYTFAFAVDTSISGTKVTNYVLALVLGADGKIVAARIDCAEIAPELDESGALVAATGILSKVEQGDSYGGDYPMSGGSWAKQTKAFEDAIVGMTVEEAVAIDMTLVAGCTMPSSPVTFKALLTEAAASENKIQFTTADPITVGVALDSYTKSGRGGKVQAFSEVAAVVFADGKVVAAAIDSIEQGFVITDGELEANEALLSKAEMGDDYQKGGMAASWEAQGLVFANALVGLTAEEVAAFEPVSDALAAAGCTLAWGADYKAAVDKAVTNVR